MQKKERGFTLVELLVSIVILGVLTTLMLPVINMSLSSSTNTSLLRYQTDTLEWYREIAKSKAIYLTTLSNEEENTAVGKVNISYESKNVGNRTYVLVKPSLGTWLPAFYITPLKPEGITTQGIYVKILSPTDGESVENGSKVTVVVEAYYIENGNKETVDSLNITINGNPCSASGSSNYTYQCTFTANGSDGTQINIVATAHKGELNQTDTIKIYVKNRSIHVRITLPHNGDTKLPGNILVYVESYLQTDTNITGIRPQTTIDGSKCTFLGNIPASYPTYRFDCNASGYQIGDIAHITSEATYDSLSASDNIYIHIGGYFRIVDITTSYNPSQTDETMPPCLNSSYNYVVVKIDQALATLWNSIGATFETSNKSYSAQAQYAYQTQGGYYYVYIPIPDELKQNWIAGENIHIEAFLHYGNINVSDSKDIDVCCDITFKFTQAYPDHSSEQRTIIAQNILTIYENTGNEEYDICGERADYTDELKEKGIIPANVEILEFKAEKLPSSYDKVYVGEFKCHGIFGLCLWWSYEGIQSVHSTEDKDVYTYYRTGDNSHNNSQYISSDGNGYNYVDFIYSSPLDSNNFFIYQYIGDYESQAPYCKWHEVGKTAFRAVKYETLQRYTIKYKGLTQITDIYEYFPTTTCAVSITGLDIIFEKSASATLYQSKCNLSSPYIAFDVYLSNYNTYLQPTYTVEVWLNTSDNHWYYTIYDSDCNGQVVQQIPDSDIISQNGIIRKFILRNIPLDKMDNLNKTSSIYTWFKYKATEDDVNTLTVTLTLSATYQGH